MRIKIICSKQISKTEYISSRSKNWSRDFATFGRQNVHEFASPGLTLALTLQLEQKFPSNNSPKFKIKRKIDFKSYYCSIKN